ncbi:uncharacterized protein LOC135208404 [Macrobrachium nipponense]|uniref:uncharacterized protein LOC135208404 n=1 Tax=Macrobrachium nipponense TaxID=159736 RepID=UPI0030C7DD1A
MAKVHVISTPDRLATDADLSDGESGSIWESASQLCREVWFYILMLNLMMGLVFIIMDVIYYDSCFLGSTLTRSVPAVVFLIGISQMSLSLIIPAFAHFLKNKHLHLHIGIPLFKSSKSTVFLFAGVMVAMSITVMMIFVMLGLAFVSSVKHCDTALVLFTQITCGIYIFIFLVIVLYLLFKKREIPAFHNHFETFKTKPVEPSPDYETLDDNNPFSEQADNLSEVNLGETPNGNTSSKEKAFTTRAALSAEMMFARYICVVVAVIWVIASVPGIPILASGSVFYNRCPNYRRVPEWLIAHGTVLMFSAAALIGGWLVGRGQETKRRLLFLIPSMIIITFLLIWPIVGFAWTDEARTAMLKDAEAEKTGCTREFVTGVLITSAIYSIPIFIFGYIICLFILSLCVATVTITVMFSLPWPSLPKISLASLPCCPSLPTMDCLPSLPECPSLSDMSCHPSLPACPSLSDICVPSCCKRSETDGEAAPQPEVQPEEEQPQ